MRAPAANRRVAAGFEARAARASELSRSSKSGGEALAFAAGLLRAQARAAERIETSHEARALRGHLALDLDVLLEPSLEIARFVAVGGPEVLAKEAAARAGEEHEIVRTRLALFWNGDRTAREDYLSRAMLRPYAEVLRARAVAADRKHAEGRCPFCGSAPAFACRRGGGEGEGAARFLGCALCGLEWPYLRIVCPACFERTPEKLPAFTSENHPGVRIESCETCGRYVKSFDLSEDARPVPEIDDLASIALDLWAIDEGYTRIEPGLAGL